MNLYAVGEISSTVLTPLPGTTVELHVPALDGYDVTSLQVTGDTVTVTPTGEYDINSDGVTWRKVFRFTMGTEPVMLTFSGAVKTG